MNPRIFWLSCILITVASAATPPVITGASQDPIDAGGQAFLLNITGTGFVPGAVAMLAGTALSTTFVSSTTLLGEITPPLRALSGGPILTVVNPDGAMSNARQIHISPVVLGINPVSALAGGAAVTVTVTGIGLTARDALLWDVAGKQTVLLPTYVNSTTLTALVPPELFSTAQSANIRIVEPLYELTSATSVTFTVLAVPVIATLSPSPVDAGGVEFLLTVTGSGFVPHSVVNWAGSPLGTTYQSSSQLLADITPQLRILSGTFPLTVTDPGVSTSTVASFTVSPVLFTVSPAAAAGGGPAVNITATGVGFTRSSVLAFSTAALPTSYVSSTTLTAVIPAALLRTNGAATLQVSDSTGAGHSLGQPFLILAAPAIATVAPASATAGSPGFTLTITGANCPAGCVVQWNGSPLTTTHPADTTLTAFVPGNLIATAGAANIQLVNQYGGASNTATFTVNPAAAVLTSLNPDSVATGSAAFPLTVNGTGFVAGSTVLWNGSALATNYVSGIQLTAFVPADLVSVRAGTSAGVTVLNPGGAVSNSLTLALDPSRPTILSLTPASTAAGIPSVEIAITGNNFATDCVVRWNGNAVGTTFTDATHVRASVPASLLVNAGVVPITVTNPSGLITNPMTFTVIPSTPAASGVSPASVTEGTPAFTLAVNGAFFAPASTVLWNRTALTTAFVSTAQLTAAVPATLVAAAGNVSITVSNPGGLVSQAVAFVVAIPPPPAIAAPAVTPGGAVNAFSSLPSVAPGMLISIYGTNFAPTDGQATATPLPTSLNGTSVSINGIAAPLLFVSATQINAQAPFEIPMGTADLIVQTGAISGSAISGGTTKGGALKSATVKVDVKAVAPGILAIPGGSHALAVNYPGGALNGSQNPVHAGEYVVLYLTGQGLVDRPVATGAEAGASPLSLPLAAVRATLGGKTAEVSFAGLAPGFVGLLQVNLLVPDIPGGEQALEVTVGDVAANSTVLSVAANR
jgi:uncharacterized protein (TIGR03437 family)